MDYVICVGIPRIKTSKAMLVDLVEPEKVTLWIPYKCLEYGNDESIVLHQESELSIQDQLLINKSII